MTITIGTGGPTDSIESVIEPTAGTFSNLITKVADEIDDTQGEYNGAIQDAIYQAIRYCEREIYYFNETRDVTFPTIEGQDWYDGADNAQIPRLVRVVAAYSERPGGERYILRRISPEALEVMADNNASTGEPYAFTYFGQRLRLYPIPDTVTYTIRLQLGPYRVAGITDQDDSNVWTTEAFDLIKARAKYIMGKDILKDAVLAAESLNDYNDQHSALKAETSRRNGTGVIQATNF